MKTYWAYDVEVDGVCKVSHSGSTLAECLERAITDAVYYQTVYPQGKVTISGILERCAVCSGSGEYRVRRVRSVKTVRCPECKGKAAIGQCGAIRFIMPDPANRISLVQAG